MTKYGTDTSLSAIDVAIVTACDKKFTPLLEGWLGSIKRAKLPTLSSIYVIDSGLDESVTAALLRADVKVISLSEFAIDELSEMPVDLKSIYIKPSLPTVFSRHEIILWIDCDCWIQSQDAIIDCVRSVDGVQFSCCVEVDRSFLPFSLNDLNESMAFGSGNIKSYYLEYLELLYTRYFDDDLAYHLKYCGMLNTGVLCMRTKSPIWGKWRRYCNDSFDKVGGFFSGDGRSPDFLLEQLSFNALIRMNDFEFNLLPSTYNWPLHLRRPYILADGTFVEPNFPFNPIDILHMTSTTKWKTFELKLHPNSDSNCARYRELSLHSPYQMKLGSG
ncbi:hypothetical protein G6L08_22550 [Agrobacterium rhizogenes]|nr:hypothetical protein [Rhizobium rhizogenes]